MNLIQKQRKKILDAVRKRVLKNRFNVAGVNYSGWAQTFDQRSLELLDASAAAFESGVQALLKELKSSHTGFYHERPSGLLPQHTINATLGRTDDPHSPKWFFLDVFDEGPASLAGIGRGDILHAVDGTPYVPPSMPPFKTGTTHVVSVSALDGSALRQLSVHVPQQKGNKNLPPILPPKSISTAMISPGVGLLRVTWFPGSMGLKFAKALDTAIAELKSHGCDRLIIDLRA